MTQIDQRIDQELSSKVQHDRHFHRTAKHAMCETA